MLNKCLLRKTKRQRLILEPPPSLSQSPQSIKAALLSKSLGPKGNQTQQLQLCLPGPMPPRPGLLGLGPTAALPLWPRQECWRCDLAMNLPPASNTHKSISSASAKQAPPSSAHPAHGEPTELSWSMQNYSPAWFHWLLSPLGSGEKKQKKNLFLIFMTPAVCSCTGQSSCI